MCASVKHVRACGRERAHALIRAHACTWFIVCVQTCTHTHMYTARQLARKYRLSQYVYSHVCTHVYTHGCTQLDNWREYLDFEEAESTTSAIKLYERCLVACANYPEFWSRYANFVETNVGAAAARAIYVRMTSVFIKRRPEAFLAHALFEEGQGKAADARKIYQELIAPDAPGASLVEAVVRFANFERRQNKLPAAIQIYKDAIAAAKDKSKNQVYLMVQLATLLSQVLRRIWRLAHRLPSQRLF